MKRLCAWCGLLLADGTLPISHGICDACSKKLLAAEDDDYQRYLLSPRDPRD